MKKRVTLLNMICGLVLQLASVISGLILPKIILSAFGSNANGLISSVNQFLSYITLVEGGITSVITANLYKPIIDNDKEKVSSIISTTNRFFRKIGILFVAYSFVLAFVYPLFVETTMDYFSVVLLVIILSMNLLVQYMFSLTLKTFLNANKKGYIVSITQTLIIFVNIILTIIVAKIIPNLHVMKFVSGLLFFIQPIVFYTYIKKYYDINWNAPSNNTLIKDRWNGFAINLAYFIHNSTDITVLTLMTDLTTVSIYSVYYLVSSGVKHFVNAGLSGIAHTVGQAYAKKDFEQLNQKMDIYEFVVFNLVTFVFSISAILITPFVDLYVSKLEDAAIYHQPLFGVLLIISEALYLVKLPHVNLAYSANKFKEISMPSFIEAGLNIIVSVILVGKFGLIGVAIGTIVAMVYRLIFHVYYTTKLVENRKQWIFYKKLFIYTCISVVGCIVCKMIFPLEEITVANWIIHGFIYAVVFGVLLLLIGILLFKNEMKFFVKYLKK